MGRSVLVVNGDADLRAALIELLQSSGYRCAGVGTYDAAHALLNVGSPACLVLLDARHEMGESFLEELEELPFGAEISVVLMTTSRRPVPLSRGRVVDVLRKPFETQALIDLVKMYCGDGSPPP